MIKKEIRCILIVLQLFIVAVAQAQTKGEWIKLADEAFKRADYATAINYYNRVLSDTAEAKHLTMPYEVTLYNEPVKADPNDTVKKAQPSQYDYLIHQIAAAYRLNSDYNTAVVYYELAAKKPEFYPEDKYWYGVALMNVKKYKEAMDQFEAVASVRTASDSLKKQATHNLSGCFYALDTNSTRRLVTVTMLDSFVNKGTACFAASYYGSPDKLLFTSARIGNVVNDPKTQQAEYLCDLYAVEKKDDKWNEAHPFQKPVNSAVHDGAGQMTLEENLFFTRWTDVNHNESAIYLSRFINNKFMEPLKLGNNVNIPGYKSAHPFVSMDGTKLFYSSNRPGGKGGMDIWFCTIDENGTTSSPTCLSDVINTAGDEITPFFHAPSSTLFFSSTGHAGLGGLDIFKSAYNIDDSVYSTPRNVGAPINSSKDDAYLIMDRMQQHGYFSSDRENCPSGHCYDIYSFDNEPINFDLSGYVFDAQTNEPLPGALVTLKDVHGNQEPQFFTTDDKGFYSTPLKEGMEYFIKAQKNKYFGDAATFATKGLTASKHFDQDFFLEKIPEGDIVIEGIEYDLDKFTLRPASKKILDKIYEVLKLNENLSIEINAHTDTRGSDAHNWKLSEGRAKSCVDYLVEKGIAKERLVSKGFGETKPLISDAQIAAMLTPEEKEAAHQKNRRTAFRVTGEGALNISSPNQ